ncbi:MAG: hypothetical protein PHH93_01645 [Prolixibacteraceae bacterium]|nr:hypothetical protein [Prolixibacteraceae bacterium]
MTKDELLSLLVSWDNLDLIISAILEQPRYMPLLMDIAINSSKPKSWRATWMADKIHDKIIFSKSGII